MIDGHGARTRSALAAGYGGASSRDIHESRAIILVKHKATDAVKRIVNGAGIDLGAVER